ncbi:MAG: hypothetical protein U0X76_06495 [Bacteroidia bacterium]
MRWHFHRTHDNLTVNVVTTHQIFNEYSSGSQKDIRDFKNVLRPCSIVRHATLPPPFRRCIL